MTGRDSVSSENSDDRQPTTEKIELEDVGDGKSDERPDSTTEKPVFSNVEAVEDIGYTQTAYQRDEVSTPTEQEPEVVEKIEIDGEEQEVTVGWTLYLIYSIIAAVIGGPFMYGYNSAVINAPHDVMGAFVNQSFNETMGRELSGDEYNAQWSLVVSLFVVGGIIGSIWFPDILAFKFGRKKSMFYTSFIAIVGSILCFITPWTGHFIVLMIGRLVVGFHSGIAMVVIQALLIELPPVHLRGASGTIGELAIVIGITFSTLIGLHFALGKDDLWGYLFFVATVFYIIHSISLWFAGESPRWLIDKNRHDKGHKMLKKLRRGASTASIRKEFEETKSISEVEQNIQRVPFLDFFKTRQLWWPLVISVNLHFCQQLTGISAINYYAKKVMVTAGVPKDDAGLAYLGLGALEVVVTLISAALVDRIGRRPLMIFGLFGQLTAHVLFTIFLAIDEPNGTIAALAIFLFAFSMGPGPIPWFMVGELFSQASRPVALSIGLLVNWICNLAVGLLFPHMLTYLGDYVVMPFAAMSFIQIIYMFLFLPETCGVSVEQVVAKFAKENSMFHVKNNWPFKNRNKKD